MPRNNSSIVMPKPFASVSNDRRHAKMPNGRRSIDPVGQSPTYPPTGFAPKVGLSDPLPPTAAVPLYKGDNKPRNINECILPLEKGESRVAAGGCSARLLVQSPAQGKPYFLFRRVL